MVKTSNELNQLWASFSEGPIQLVATADGYPDFHIKRLDLLNAWTTGNKYYKLKYVVQTALLQGVKTIISKGGMFSNHLAALSSTCKAFDLNLIAVVRSYTHDEENPSIKRLRSNGDEIMFVSPSAYTLFDAAKAEVLSPDAMFIPEGGLTVLGIKGSAEIALECKDMNPSHIILAGGTMSTACGILSALPAHCRLVIVPAWKGCSDPYFEEILDQYKIQYKGTWEIWPDYHFGGFGKFNQPLIDCMTAFKQETGIPLDPVYTGKLIYAVQDKLGSGYFNLTDSIVAIHSGGLQGLDGYKYRFPEIWGNL